MSFVPHDVAELNAKDSFCKLLGISHVESGDGYAVFEVTLGPEHINFLGGCHGGVIFSLADSAFGSACNATGNVSVGIDTHMAYIKGAREGDVLRAAARRISESSKTAVYRADVTRGEDVLATFTGTAFKTGKNVEEFLD